MSYDPSRKRSRNSVPPQLRAWVFGRRKKRTQDPKRVSMATGYGSVGKKPYRRGSRGGVAWSGGKRLRYDPNFKGAWGRATAKAKGVLGKVENNLQWIGLTLGLIVPAEVCRVGHGLSLKSYWWDATRQELQTLFGKDPRNLYTPTDYLQFKFLDYRSSWSIAFWASLIAQIVTRLGVLKAVSVRANTAVKKFTLGTLIAATFGALFLGGGPTVSSNTVSSNPNSAGRRNVAIPTNQNLMIGGAF